MKYFTILLAMMFSTTALFSQNSYKMEVGDQLIYHVETETAEYDFTVIPTKLSQTGIVFQYKMGEPANLQGVISMSTDALKNATAMYNKFSGGNVNLTDQISVFASQAIMNAASDGTGLISTDGSAANAEDFTTLAGNTSPTNNSTYMKMVKNINGIDFILDGPIMENEDGSKTVRFADGGGYPFITYMKIDFKIYLKEIIRKK